MSSVPLNGSSEFVRRGTPQFTIRPSGAWRALNLLETWRFRDLMMSLATRDLKLRYKQTALGVIWVVLQPLMTAGIFSIVFGLIAKMDTGKIPMFVYSFAGLLGFNLFANTVTRSSTCLIGNSQLITKVFFPRLVLPFSTVPAVLIDFAVAAVLMALLMICFHSRIDPSVGSLLTLPLWIAMVLMLALGVGLCASALTVQYRDIQYIVPFLLQILTYASPIPYMLSRVPDGLRPWYMLNPISVLVSGIDWSLLGTEAPPALGIAYTVVVSVGLFVAGAFSFKRMEKQFADVI